MTRERIEDFREIVLPFLSSILLNTNYENMGKSDAEEFEKDLNEILDLAIKELEQEPTTKNETLVSLDAYKQVAWERDIAIQQLHELGYEFGQKIEPTTKNDLPHCQHTDEEIAKSFIEDVEAVKDQLPCGQMMDFPNTFDEFAKDYGFRDKKEIYTNGSELIPVFRVKQWLEHIATTKNDLGVSSELEKNSKKLEKDFGELDCISREQALKELKESAEHHVNDSGEEVLLRRDRDIIRALPSVTPQEPKTGHWKDIPKYKDIAWYCSECERFTTMKHNYCPKCGAKMVNQQESEDKA